MLQNYKAEAKEMNKSVIGLILAAIGFIIMLVGSYQTNFFECNIVIVIGGILFILGILILAARFRKWSSE